MNIIEFISDESNVELVFYLCKFKYLAPSTLKYTRNPPKINICHTYFVVYTMVIITVLNPMLYRYL